MNKLFEAEALKQLQTLPEFNIECKGILNVVRVTTEVAKKWLLTNTYVVRDDKYRYLQMTYLNLGVWEVALNAVGVKTTHVVSSLFPVQVGGTNREEKVIVGYVDDASY